jgi:hypothetical protein
MREGHEWYVDAGQPRDQRRPGAAREHHAIGLHRALVGHYCAHASLLDGDRLNGGLDMKFGPTHACAAR